MATVNQERYLNIQLKDSTDSTRTIKVPNPKTDTTALQNAVTNFCENYILNQEANILVGAKGDTITGVNVDLIETTRTKNLYQFGDTAGGILLNKYSLNFTAVNQTEVITVSNYEGPITAEWLETNGDTYFDIEISGGNIVLTYIRTIAGSDFNLKITGSNSEGTQTVLVSVNADVG